VTNLPPEAVAAQLREELAVRERLTRQRLNLVGLGAILFTILAGISIWQASLPHTTTTSAGLGMASLPEDYSWKQLVLAFCDDEKLTPDFDRTCEALFPLKVRGGKITYDGIENLIELLTLRVEGPVASPKLKAIVQKQDGIINITCQ